MAMPYAGRVAVANVDAHHGAEHLLRVWLQMLATGVMPFDWWRLDSLPVAESWSGFARYVAFLLLAGGFVLAAAIRAASNLPRRPSVEVYCPLAIAVGWIPLLEITGDHYYGYYRHHVHFALPGLVLMAGWGIDSALDGRVIVILRRVSLVLPSRRQSMAGLAVPVLGHEAPCADASFWCARRSR
jgi:hypothetical protein